ncbi:MAG: DUF2071 domain-containing protein [Verrucomicrobiae bacterium]|nr:DUF2071 domain-containing protein [Verrucomicrobiae bacterium]
MKYLLQRHPFPVDAFFRDALVLTYAVPERVLEPLVAPGLALETAGDQAFVAIALVQTEGLRPSGLPGWLGQDFFLAGYRIFVRFGERRGLQILRSLTDRPAMAFCGNVLTHYNYGVERVDQTRRDDRWSIRVGDPKRPYLQVEARLGGEAALPEGSPFAHWNEARRYCGPLPLTFDYERQTRSIVIIRATRPRWRPSPARVEVRANRFFEEAPFFLCRPALASAFHVANVPYRWERGVRQSLMKEAA